ncbi:type II toxin-antitoxin system MqsA family antitoxin [Caenimonas koreensis]|uniref:type II toxin-antitoxin system MqsA family antitoxin n=1 Tax=Caenimonas koreensis TaxID=367474 RepID=UPI00188E3C70|nr:type II toxin-antitoxin system MqsA family antitoxin [Caenimonas koreensis]
MSENHIHCPFCESKEVHEVLHETSCEFKGLTLWLQQSFSRCGVCGYEFETANQHDRNLLALREKFASTKAAFKSTQGLLTAVEIRAIRKKLDLTQHEAANLFGGGLNAFSKYENDEVVQSVSMDRLLRLANTLGPAFVPAMSKALGKPESRGAVGETAPALTHRSSFKSVLHAKLRYDRLSMSTQLGSGYKKSATSSIQGQERKYETAIKPHRSVRGRDRGHSGWSSEFKNSIH